MALISHLQAGHIKSLSPSSKKVSDSKKLITSLIKEKLQISIDEPSTQGGGSTTGNVVRRCFKRIDDMQQDFL